MAIERRVVVAGWGQVKQPKKLSGKAKDPMGLMIQASVNAAQKTVSKQILKDLDGIMVVRTLSRHFSHPDQQLASCLGATPRYSMVSGIGGNSPQTLINMAAGMIARNQLDSVLIAGAEAYVQRGDRSEKIDSALFRGIPKNYPGDDLIGATPLEKRHGLEHPMQGFPLFETALWAASGLAITEYLQEIGEMWERFSTTAAGHPYAWSKEAKTAAQIISAGPENRPVAFPYTKYMNSYVTVDQGAALILMSEEKAKKNTVAGRQTVYFLGGGYAQDSQRFMVEKSDFTDSPPLQKAVEKALTRSNMKLKDLDCFDLYSCFPSAVTIAKKMIGIQEDDPRPLTVTGGLGFFGGPGNNYSLHSAATLADMISKGEKSNGLVTALGWFMHKHAAGVYGNRPLGGAFEDHDRIDQEKPFWGVKPVQIKDQVNGTGRIETYTVIFTIDREPAYAILYGRTDDNFRFVAGTENDPSIFQALMSESLVGTKVAVQYNPAADRNVARLI